jgi:hypothetical protein
MPQSGCSGKELSLYLPDVSLLFPQRPSCVFVAWWLGWQTKSRILVCVTIRLEYIRWQRYNCVRLVGPMLPVSRHCTPWHVMTHSHLFSLDERDMDDSSTWRPSLSYFLNRDCSLHIDMLSFGSENVAFPSHPQNSKGERVYKKHNLAFLYRSVT